MSIVEFRKALEAQTSAGFMLDPGDKSWWIDAFTDKRVVTINWREGKGFGIYTGGRDDYGFGEGPDEVIKEMDKAVARVVELLKCA